MLMANITGRSFQRQVVTSYWKGFKRPFAPAGRPHSRAIRGRQQATFALLRRGECADFQLFLLQRNLGAEVGIASSIRIIMVPHVFCSQPSRWLLKAILLQVELITNLCKATLRMYFWKSRVTKRQ